LIVFQRCPNQAKRSITEDDLDDTYIVTVKLAITEEVVTVKPDPTTQVPLTTEKGEYT